MKKHILSALGVVTALTLVFSMAETPEAQQQRASPHETVTATVAGAKVSITYGRPYMKGRAIFGGLRLCVPLLIAT